ncbi:MAG TPA: hypothetical protein VF950_29425 [Planctomycetota bacterium]
MRWLPLLALSVVEGLLLGCSTPETRAVDFLAREVPKWRAENGCFSCHNNGDAARALIAAGREVDPATLAFLRRPESWKDNGPDKEFSDKKLAALQFAFALAESGERGEALRRAAALIQRDADGSFGVDAGGLAGSPITYGRTLATVVARRVLSLAGQPVEVTDAWLKARKPATPLDAGALLLRGPRADCVELLRTSQASDGSWDGEVFDTAIALLGLANTGERELIRRGRDFLLTRQYSDGSWPETTRPPGAESYAQRISTSAWATLALLVTK